MSSEQIAMGNEQAGTKRLALEQSADALSRELTHSDWYPAKGSGK
jgi:hypothetical protein